MSEYHRTCITAAAALSPTLNNINNCWKKAYSKEQLSVIKRNLRISSVSLSVSCCSFNNDESVITETCLIFGECLV